MIRVGQKYNIASVTAFAAELMYYCVALCCSERQNIIGIFRSLIHTYVCSKSNWGLIITKRQASICSCGSFEGRTRYVCTVHTCRVHLLYPRPSPPPPPLFFSLFFFEHLSEREAKHLAQTESLWIITWGEKHCFGPPPPTPKKTP